MIDKKKKAEQQWSAITKTDDNSAKFAAPKKPKRSVHDKPMCAYCGKPHEGKTGRIYHAHCLRKMKAEISHAEDDGIGLM